MAVNQLMRELHELIAALDRRVPRVERAGEASIARDAAALRAKAVTRLAELTAEASPDSTVSDSSQPKQEAAGERTNDPEQHPWD